MKSLILLTFLFSITAQAGDRFLPLRKDHNVPAHCQNMTLNNFMEVMPWFTLGRKGAEGFGFTKEVPLDRDDANTLWKFMKSIAKKSEGDFEVWKEIREDEEMYGHYQTLLDHHKEMGVDFGNEGEVLEVIGSEALREMYPGPMYYVTGGIEYRASSATRTIGELDLLVADAQSCQVLMIGEVKLGSGRSLSKARSQLHRFSNFLIKRERPGIGEEAELAHQQEEVDCKLPAAL